MSSEATLIFPHQLFENHPALDKSRAIYLIEEWLFFQQYNFHKKKLVLHRASMKFYENWLKDQGYTVHYINTTEAASDGRILVKDLAEQKIIDLHIADVADNWLLKRLRASCAGQRRRAAYL